MDYLRQLEAQDPSSESGERTMCFLCAAAEAAMDSDAAHRRLVLINDDRGVMLLNRYPYTNGHLLISPRRHLGSLADLDRAGRGDLIELTALGENVLKMALNPQGINVGINIGRCAGAGLPGHLHVHIVPRWSGDTNFMQTVGRVRVIPEALEESYRHLRTTLQQIEEG
jgi:ATP adenylyltransferase